MFVLYKTLVYLINFNVLFSEDRLILNSVTSLGFKIDLAYVLSNYYSETLLKGSIILTALFAVLGLLKKSTYVSNFGLWFLVLNLSNFIYPTLTAGDYLLNQLLFFNVFFSHQQSRFGILNELKVAIHNAGLLAIKIQICLAYLFAAWFKFIDVDWLNGLAVYQTFQTPEYSNDLFKEIPYSWCVVLNYATMLYQLCFPLLIWFRKYKVYLFIFGITQHLLIAFGMGLFSFGIIMILCYILFLKYDN